MKPQRTRDFLCLGTLAVLLALSTFSVLAAEPPVRVNVIGAKAIGGVWQAQGPGPNTQGQVENIIPNDEVVGAVNTLAAHPTNANILYAGGVNGGVWKTTNATATSPTWVQQTDAKASLSMGAVEFDPTDGTYQTLVAGIGRFSSYSRKGGPRIGMLRTTNGGATWTTIDGGGALIGKNIAGIAGRGATIVIAVDNADNYVYDEVGIFRSTNTGATWTQISVGDGSTTGLPGGVSYDLASDPSNNSVLYTNIQFAATGGSNGIYKSTNSGATWTKVSTSTMDSQINSNTDKVEISVGSSNNVYVVIVNSGSLARVYRSGNGGSSWSSMDVPDVHRGGQGGIHLSVAADRSNSNLVYIGGDRQDIPGDLNASDYSGRIFRCDASRSSGSQCFHMTHSTSVGRSGGGTASSSSPHADSRDMAMDANGQLIEADDGGIYRRTSPQNNSGDWFSINGTIQTTEFHNGVYDSNANIIFGGAQDTGSPAQLTPDGLTWYSITTADGGDVAVDDSSVAGQSTRYSSTQFMGAFRRQRFNASNNLLSSTSPSRTVVGGGSNPSYSFTNPMEVNAITPTRVLIGASNALYESFDECNTMTQLSPAIGINAGGADPLAYGAGSNANAIYAGSGDDVYIRTGGTSSSLVRSTSYPGDGSGRNVIDIVLDTDNANTAFVIDASNIYRTTNAGSSWSTLNGNLFSSFNPGSLHSVTYIAKLSGDFLVVGATTGVYASSESSGFSSWDQLGTSFPNAPTYDLDYDVADDVLVAITLGRGAWSLSPTPTPSCSVNADCDDGLFCNGAETCDTGSGLCLAGSDPCPGEGCDESGDVCTGAGACTHDADFEGSSDGWSNGADSCTTGSFVAGTPTATDWQVASGNPGGAYYTQPNTAIGTDDVDGGTCEALSPAVDCNGQTEANISLDYFHGQRDAADDATDGFTIEILNDGAVVQTIVDIGDVTNNAAWTNVSTTVNNPGDIQIRVRATDGTAGGDIIEGGIDNVTISAATPGCSVNADCDDGLFCNGAETCNAGTCQAGTAPNCSDGVSCTDDSCNESTDSCDNIVNNANCDDGLFCNGSETCSATLGCQAGSDPCPGQSCDEGGDVCTGSSSCPPGSLDFSSLALTSYADQNASNATSVEDGGDTLRITGNTWVRTTQTFNVTANTVIDFDFTGTTQGEIHAIGFDENDTTTDALRLFAFWGTQDWTGDINWTPAYSGGTQSFSIPVGQSYTGNMWLVLAGDDDASAASNAAFSCVRVYEATSSCTVDEDFESDATGWVNDGASTCTTGAYTSGNPTNATNGFQIVGSNSGTSSLFTAVNTSAGVDDVDGGNCILGSPSWSVTNASTLSVWYWHGQRDAGDDSGDFFSLEVSTNGGSTWTTIASNGDSTSNPVWTQATAQIPAGSNVQLRMQCADGTADGDLIECGLDDVSICDN